MVVIKETKAVNIAEPVEPADIGDTEGHSVLAVSIGGEGEPKAIWIKSIYGVPDTTGGVLLLHHVTVSGTWIARATSNIDLALYMSTTGDGLTQVNIGPIEHDLYLSTDAVFDCGVANRITIEYEQV